MASRNPLRRTVRVSDAELRGLLVGVHTAAPHRAAEDADLQVGSKRAGRMARPWIQRRDGATRRETIRACEEAPARGPLGIQVSLLPVSV
jgi:hypothetical protein